MESSCEHGPSNTSGVNAGHTMALSRDRRNGTLGPFGDCLGELPACNHPYRSSLRLSDSSRHLPLIPIPP